MCPMNDVPLVDQVTAERFSLPLREAGRARRIAAIHALANFYAEHPEIPAPAVVRAHTYVDSLEELEVLATLHDGVIYGRSPQFNLDPIPGEEANVGIIVAKLPDNARPL